MAMRNALDAGQPVARSRWWRRVPLSGVAGAAFWLALFFGLLWLLRQVPSADGALLGWMQLLVGVALLALAFPLAWTLIRTRLLWSLSSKLILTYLLIGLAPVVLVVTFAAISVYIAAGQFSIHLADSRMRQELDELGLQNVSRASATARAMRARAAGLIGPPRPRGPRPGSAGPSGPPRAGLGTEPGAGPNGGQNASDAVSSGVTDEATQATTLSEALPDPLRARLHPHTAIYLNGAPQTGFAGPSLGPPGDAPAQAAAVHAPLGLPPWAADLRGKEFRGLVLDGDDLYLVAIDQRRVEGSDLVSVVTSLPVDSALLSFVAKGLGRVQLAGLLTGSASVAPASGTSGAGARPVQVRELERASVSGGSEPLPVNFFDLRVPFVSTLDTIDWDSGQSDIVSTTIKVESRPSLLYKQLFGSSLSGIVTSYLRNGLVALCIAFALIEALALWMALRLSRAITASVEELYAATQRVDRGDFAHRIAAPAMGQQDQLGELARSFNSMTGSLQRLLLEQKEKERLQGELSIAQEVQANLFPSRARDLPTLELHGICRPARSVSGDYYDFLVFHHAPDGQGAARANGANGKESGVGIVLGDISGKGISAALLMATLHSAVRAYRFASEDLVYSENSIAGLMVPREGLAGDSGKLFESPGRILSLLNRHLYRSTQPEKYATIFLAHYDAASAQLTYSNAGHLPPLLLGRDGKVRRLECGGTVVGLMDGMRYEEGRVAMRPGDILVAYSDGVTEPENDFGEFGEARLLEVVARYREQPLHVISAQVMLALDAWIGAEEQPDDITLVLARQV
jgi:sigma-B regulation protein RsbU (phosphoserine phosphatase)